MFSGGFIEHFSGESLEKIEQKHVELMESGGKLVITVPNFNYGQYLIHYILDKKNLDEHNVKTMSRSYYRRFAKQYGLNIIFLGYTGGFFDFWPRNIKPWWNPSHKLFFKGLVWFRTMTVKMKLQPYCNSVLSPYLIFIAEKPIADQTDQPS